MKIGMFRVGLFFASCWLAMALSPAFGQTAPRQTHGLSFGNEERLEILPVLFVPSDNSAITLELANELSDLLYAHLTLLQRTFNDLLKTDTFKIADGTLEVYRSNKPHSFYRRPDDEAGMKAWHEAFPAKVILDWRRDNRYESKYIYLIIYARPTSVAVAEGNGHRFGSAGPFNGMPNSGGGFVLMELSSLMFDVPYSFQATLAHELGHAFGLAHGECYGYSMATNDGFMSHNQKLVTKGVVRSPGIFNPEDYYVLSRNKMAFPRFEYVEAIHNSQRRILDRIETCYLSALGSYLGAFKQIARTGYELYFDGRRVSTGEAAFTSFKFARDSCRWNRAAHRNIRVDCRYHGTVFDPAPEPKAPSIAGAWCLKSGDSRSLEQPAFITQSGKSLTFSTPISSSRGHFRSNDFDAYNMVVADDWKDWGPYVQSAIISPDGTRLDWADGSVWLRKSKCAERVER